VIIPANQLGKLKTVMQALVVFVLLIADPSGALTQALVYLMVAITLLSGAVYAAGYMRGRRILAPRVATA
jgi:phosphatidylglycerophosphate synthase